MRERPFRKRDSFTPLEMNESLSKSNGNTSARRITKKKRFLSLTGFTLIELIIVIIIIGILAGIAIPRFIRTAEKARGEEAIVNLRLIFAGERMYRLDNNIYSSCLAGAAGAGCLSPEYIEDMTTPARQKYFSFFVLLVDSDGFLALATRKSGIYSGRGIWITHNEDWGGNWPWVPE